MKIINPLQMNDWPIKTFLIVIFQFQLLLWGSIGLDSIGIQLPIIRQLICFMYLTFVPGILILRVLRLHKLGSVKSLLYSMGLSLSFLMFVGFSMNRLYPVIGINKPISIIPLVLTISFIVLLLCYLCYSVDRNFSDSDYFDLSDVFSVPYLFLYLIPVLTINGTYLMNAYNNNYLLMHVIFFTSLIVILIAFDFIPSSVYPLAIYSTSFSLLFHNSLISKYVFGWDIQNEYFTANEVIIHSFWNASTYSNTNAMLSIVMLAPIYSILSKLDLSWVFKIVYPVIFSFISVGLYLIFKRQTTDKIAFMAAFFFTSFFVFYTEMLQLSRQEIAEYFFMLVLLIIIENKQDLPNRLLLVIFSLSVIVSHYGISYLILASIICTYILFAFIRKHSGKIFPKNKITLTFTCLFATFLLSWYIYVSSSSAAYTILAIIKNIVVNFISDFLNPDKAQGLYVISQKTVTPLHEFAKIIHIITQVFISIGIVYILKNNSKKDLKFNREYLSFCLIFYLILIASIAVPNFSSALNTSRLYQITLILLAPFCVIGGIVLLRILFNKILQARIKKNMDPVKALSIFFAIFLLFNTGWIYEAIGDSPTSFSLNKTIDYPMFNDKDVAGKEWLHHVNRIKENNGYIYADFYRWVIFRSCFYDQCIFQLPESIDQIPINSYIYLSTYNVLRNEIQIIYLRYISFDPYISSKHEIYNNGGAKIYY